MFSTFHSVVLANANKQPVMAAAPAAATVGGVKKPWNSRTAGHVVHDNMYYFKCMIAGVLSCGGTHTLITPLDVAKCNMQVNPGKYKGLFPTIRKIMAEEGSSAVWKGWAPTAIGYSMQGFNKFGFYEIFKDVYSNMAGEEAAYKYRGLIYLCGSASAEFIADIALCPMEMVKVKVQTSPKGTWPLGLVEATQLMNSRKADTRFPFGSVIPLWSRQIPYTMAKFYFFEKVVEAFYTHIFTNPKDTYSKATQLGITFASGYTAGVICAIVSHPADSLVSQLGKADNKGKPIGQIAREVGAWKLCTGGLGTRILMIGTLTGLQWWIYDTFKTVCGMGTTGGAVKKH